jgi:hypothetical protein
MRPDAATWVIELLAGHRAETLTSSHDDDDPAFDWFTYLGRYTGISRRTASRACVFLVWCTDQTFVPLRVQRTQIERYVHRKSGVQPSMVSRRIAMVTGFCRTCVIDAVLEHSPADYVHRPPSCRRSD